MTDFFNKMGQVMPETPPKAETPENIGEIASGLPSSEGTELDLIRNELKTKEQAVKEQVDRYLRTLADFENYKKRSQKDQIEQAKFSNERLIKEFLPVLDNLDRAIAHSRETRDFEKILAGVELTYKEFISVLSRFGVNPIESLHKPFDPTYHQAVGQVELKDGAGPPDDHVVNEVQKGYCLHERLLRPSLVMVSKKASPQVSEDAEGSGSVTK